MRVERPALGSLQPRVRDVQVVLGRGELAGRLVVQRLKLGALGLDAAVGQGVEARPGGLHQRLRAHHLGLQCGLTGWRATPTQQVELALGRLDRRVAGLDGCVGGSLRFAARGAVARLGCKAQRRGAQAGRLLLQSSLVRLGSRLLCLCRANRGLCLGNRSLRRIGGLIQRRLSRAERRLGLIVGRLGSLNVGGAGAGLVVEGRIGGAHRRLRSIDLGLQRVDLALEAFEVGG